MLSVPTREAGRRRSAGPFSGTWSKRPVRQDALGRSRSMLFVQEPLSVSVTAVDESSDEGSCTGSHKTQFLSSWHSSDCSWKAARGSCSRAGSDFAGLKVDYDAFRTVPIVPGYFSRDRSIDSMDHG